MRIAQISPLFESVPPKFYGGTERVVSYLTEELVRQGHNVTLYATGDSRTSAKLIPICDTALFKSKPVFPTAYQFLAVEQIIKDANQFDVIHSHLDFFGYSTLRRLQTPHITTLHGRMDFSEYTPLYKEFSCSPLVSVSNHQRTPQPFANWKGTVYHGLPSSLFKLEKNKGKYLAFLGRLSHEKGIEDAVEISKRLNLPLKIAGVYDHYFDYYQNTLKPLFNSPLIEFVGELTDSEKQEFLGNAYALLFPIKWPEPFGLVMIEAMACGTPVIATRCGSVPEVIEEGVSGYIVDTLEEAVQAVKKVENLSRVECRKAFEKRFTVEKMVSEYLNIYKKIAGTN